MALAVPQKALPFPRAGFSPCKTVRCREQRWQRPDAAGFYETWFTSDANRLRFLRHTLALPCWGDPELTFCDVERAIQQEIRKRNYLARYKLRAAEAVRSREMEILKQLEAKYRTVSPPAAEEHAERVAPAITPPQADGTTRFPVQASLF
jgi:hypothetical protein